MFIRPTSDVHNEFSLFNLPATAVDERAVLILAGDIALADSTNSTLVPFLDDVSPRFSDVLYIPGNHEYYHSSLARADAKLEAVCKRYQNVHYMQKRHMVIGDVMFIGATLWTDFNRGDPMATWEAQQAMNDFRVIRTGSTAEPYKRKARPIDMMGINTDHRLFLKDSLELARHAGKRAVVFTHHAPSMQSNTGHYPAGPLDYAYYNTGLEDLMFDYEPVLWIHGHSHHPIDYIIGKTRVVSNPRGYTRNSNGCEGLGFNGELVVEL